VMQFHSISTLILLSSIMIVVWVYEDVSGLCPPRDHCSGRGAARHQAQFASVQPLIAVAARLFRAPPGRRDDVPGGAGLPGPRVPDRAIAGDVSRHVDPGGVAAVSVLAHC